MSAELIEVEVWVLVDENGDYEVSKDAGDLQAESGLASRMVKIKVNVPTPQAVELVGTVEAEPAVGELKVA
ncbi:unnamed protein product [Gemmata massiliana]|uniref:Uncharacterized protein n=1 Tax=Gemmata massiliana TaxID=1210884 RepID=A0A6P2DMH4_9BACT|nr:hypothetical protein [Gemmata massiliana]VTS03788.1 unnamed protein product [Gemmata massiliana]